MRNLWNEPENFEMRVNTSRNGAIELFRFLLACAIVGLHMSGYYAEPGHYFHGGYIAVDCFFVLSGLLAMVSYHHSIQTDPDATPSRRLMQILGKKWRSIYPTYIISFAILFGFMETIVYRNGPISMLSGLAAAMGEALGIDIFGLGGGPATGGYLYYNVPAWYFSAMFAGLVLVLYITIKLDENAYSLVFPGISVILYGYLHLKVGHLQIFEILGNRWLYPVWRAVAGLCLGAFSSLPYYWLSAVHLRSEGKMLRSAIELLLAGGILGYIYRPWAQYGVVDFSIPFLCALLFPLLLSHQGGDTVPHKIACLLGWISMPLWLNHYLVIRIFQMFQFKVNVWEAYFLILLISVAVAVVVQLSSDILVKVLKILAHKGKYLLIEE